MYEDLKRNLENVIKKESEKQFHSTGELRIDWMAKDCLDAITDLTTNLAEAKADLAAAVEDIRRYPGVTPCRYCKNNTGGKISDKCTFEGRACFEYRGRNKGNG